ncbi:MAG: HlyC/CorC family transporter [Gammaproteobacteria bacterium]|nr:HlyC/CorC family transporter [Gammaproteobacteria bacterium]
MDDVSILLLSGILIVLIAVAAFFSGSETSMMAVNRYRLRHLADDGHKGAMQTANLLERPDRLLGLILFCNNIVNFYVAALGVVIAVRLMGDIGYALGPVILTFIFLVLAEAAPKTMAAYHPERFAFPASYILRPLSVICQPFVWTINWLANNLLAMLRLKLEEAQQTSLSREELKTALSEAGKMLPSRHLKMLHGILDLEQVTVEDIMVPRNEITGIDINDDLNENLSYLSQSSHTRLPLYRDNLDEIIGLIHVRRVLRLLKDADEITREDLEEIAEEPQFVSFVTSLNAQLLNFQRTKKRLGFVIDEYGTIQGLVTMEDILEEVVGEFTTDLQTYSPDIVAQDDGSFMIDGGATMRDINRELGWELPASGPKTLNGLVLERLETMPEPGMTLKLDSYTLEIAQVTDNAVKSVRVKLLKQEDWVSPPRRP